MKKSRIRQIGGIVFVSLWLERALALGTDALELGTVSGVSAPTGLTVVSCATISDNTLASVHPATASIISDSGAAKITLRATQASDTMVFINSYYFTGS